MIILLISLKFIRFDRHIFLCFDQLFVFLRNCRFIMVNSSRGRLRMWRLSFSDQHSLFDFYLLFNSLPCSYYFQLCHWFHSSNAEMHQSLISSFLLPSLSYSFYASLFLSSVLVFTLLPSSTTYSYSTKLHC